MRVLIIDGNTASVGRISECFKQRWPETVIFSAAQGEEGIRTFKRELPDVVILEKDLLEMDGLKVLSSIRSFSNVPLIVFSNNGDDKAMAEAFKLGADNYIHKSVFSEDFLLRVQAVLRRASALEPKKETSLMCGSLTMNPINHSASIDGQELPLSFLEYNLLRYLMENKGRILTHGELLKEVWGSDYDDDKNKSCVLKVIICRLRKKIKSKNGDTVMIKNICRMGYILKNECS